MRFLSGLLLVGLITFLACTKDEVTEPTQPEEYLIFGTVYGFCLGDCVTLFRLEKDNIYKDSVLTNVIASDTIPFYVSSLGNAKYQLAKGLKDNFPSQLFQESEPVIGIPDAYDQGTVFIEYSDGEVVKKWRIDTNVQALPEYLQTYIQRVLDITAELRG
jgi:hypothetical protein